VRRERLGSPVYSGCGRGERLGRDHQQRHHKDSKHMADTILSILLWALQLLTIALVGRAILSWIDPGQQWGISRILAEITEPIIAPLRRVIPPFGMIDISFIVAILLIQVLERLLRQALM
jgi:YggT family protein